ncbi:TRAP transporter small permease subunit [Marinomonas sp.]|uniref:TRAP transporter small permease subunit n=1 Tax=Marinomonas sp. TaxID=1904862 RepID=UPI003BAC2891
MSAFVRLQKTYGVYLHWSGLTAGYMTLAMMLLVGSNVITRYIFNYSIPGTLEFTESMLTVLIFLSLALTQYEGGHIQVVLLTKKLPSSARRIVMVLTLLLGVAFFSWCSWGAWQYAMKSFMINEQQWGSVRFTLYPIKFVLFIGLLSLAIQFVFDAISTALGLDPHEKEDTSKTTLEESI